MKTCSTIFIILLSYCATAQTNNKLDSTTIGYYNRLNIPIDSCSNLQLYDELCGWIETPYAYAECSRYGSDCSGLVKTILLHVYDIQVEGTSASLYNLCVPIEKEYLEEGDLVFFKIGSKKITHVGLYLRNNTFIHASTKKGVIISNLDEKYYSKYFYSGGRLKNKTN